MEKAQGAKRALEEAEEELRVLREEQGDKVRIRVFSGLLG